MRARDLAAGAVITDADVIALRPERGLPASRWRELIGLRTTRLAAFDPFHGEDLGDAVTAHDGPVERRA
jgi:sialic acid synthase SpsE